MVKRWRVLLEVLMDAPKGAKKTEVVAAAVEMMSREFVLPTRVVNIEEVGDVARGVEAVDSDYPLPAGVLCDMCG